jgi:AcrR family transcriptional regulator
MYSENSPSIQVRPKRSFIEEARRAQIVTATIETLAELGYSKASLAQIAKRAGISTSLIPYHFKDKDELINQTLTEIYAGWAAYVHKELAESATAAEKLRVYIESNLAYMGTRPKHFIALMEIYFVARKEDGMPLYRVDQESLDDPSILDLEESLMDLDGKGPVSGVLYLEEALMAILSEGQQRGEFRQFDVHNMTIAIRGGIDQFLGQMASRPSFNLETYTTELVDLFDRATRQA